MSDISSELTQHREKIIADLRSIMDDAESILQETANETGEKAKEFRSRIQLRLASANVSLARLERNVLKKGRAAAKAADEYIHEQPWNAVGISALIGLGIGVLIGRR
jgi:ElaB/YqjD/DUF883 family membrane-anchored ribosome-binding protein